MNPYRWSKLMGVVSLCWCAACGPSTPPAKPGPTPARDPGETSNRTPVLAPPQEEASFPAMADDQMGPVRSVKRALRAVYDAKLDRAYDYLPNQYQLDLDAVVHEFAGKMDPEVWDQVFATLRKGITVLKVKKELLIEAVRASRPEEGARLAATWDDLVATLEEAANSDLGELAALKKLSTRRFLEQTGNRLFEQVRSLSAGLESDPLERLKDPEIEIVSRSPERVVLRFQGWDGGEPIEVTVVPTGERWIPETLFLTWKDNIADVRQQLARLTPETMAPRNELLKDFCKVASDSFDRMLDAEKVEDLQAAFYPVLLKGLQTWSAWNAASIPRDGVTLVIEGEYDDSSETRMLRKLERLTDDPPHTTYEATGSSGRVTILLRPVADPVKFAEKLTIDGNKSVDVKNRTITISGWEP